MRHKRRRKPCSPRRMLGHNPVKSARRKLYDAVARAAESSRKRREIDAANAYDQVLYWFGLYGAI